jgi:hypothetical protein
MKFLWAFLFLIIFPTMFLIATPADNLGVHAQSFSGSMRARGDAGDVIYYNPAGMIKKRKFGFDLDYMYEASPEAHRTGASIVDSQTGVWALGIAYNGHYFKQPQVPHAHLFNVSAAMPIVSDMFALGVAFKYTHDRNIGPEPYANFFNMDVGFLANVPLGLSLGVVADNIIKAKGHEKSIGLGLAAAYDFGVLIPLLPLSLSIDWVMADVANKENLKHKLMAGVEYSIVGVVPVRLGYNSDLTTKQKYISVGTGITVGIFACDVLYQQNPQIGKDRTFGMGMRFSI